MAMSDTSRATRKSSQFPPALSTPNPGHEEGAPVEAVRAVAALLGRAALPRTEPSVSRSGAREASEGSLGESPRGDREVPITGSVATLSDDARDAVRDAQKRQRRAAKRVKVVLERLATDAPDGLST
jgi:hypothetical protein